MAFDLANHIPRPHGAACITLTNAAAEELRRRIDLLGVERRPNLFIGTVHSFAIQRVIGPFCGLIGRPELSKLSIPSKQQVDRAYSVAINSVIGSRGDTRYVRSTIEYNRQRLATTEDWAKSGDEIIAVARRYAEILETNGLHDFLDILAIAVDMVEQHKVIRQVLTARYPNLYVDEYQDLAPALDRLVRALCFDYAANAELFAVGDADQAVFAFTGTRPELLDELAGRSDVTAVHLDHNYRCGNEIIRIANLMRRGKAPIKGNRLGGAVTATLCPRGFPDQCLRAVEAVKVAAERGVPLHEVVAICPTNQQCEQVAAALREHRIPAFVRGSEYRLTPVTSFVEGCAAWATLGRECSNYRLGSLLRRWRTILAGRWERSDSVKLTELLTSYQERSETAAGELLRDLLQLGMSAGLDRPELADDRVEVAQMASALESGPLSDHSVHDLAERARKVDRVEVTTMTSSKGLEFDVVLILGVDEKWVPHVMSEGDPQKLAEDRRKFYVSITRARDEVRIFYSGFVVWASGRISRAGPSRFLREIGLI